MAPALRLLPVVLLASTLTPHATAQTAAAEAAPAALPTGAPAAMAHVDRGDLQRHATYLASDELGGRYTGSAGQRAAAEYIAQHFEQLGLLPLGDKERGGRSYLQRYPLERTYLEPKGTLIQVGTDRYTAGFAVVPGKKEGKVSVKGGFVFCGDGSEEQLPRGSLKNKVPVVVLRDQAGTGARAAMRASRSFHRSAAVARAMARRGARTVILCLLESTGTADALNTGALLPDKPLLRFGNDRGRAIQPHGIPTVFAGKPLTEALLRALGVQPNQSGAGKPVTAKGSATLWVRSDKKFHADNVVAYRAGSSAAKEAVVFSAHMDHMGTRVDGDAFNGADDNASGTAGLLEIAEAFARAEPPRRSVVFLAVSGEELGLWGSAYFADHPTWPASAIVANVNIDMIGRNDGGRIQVTPSHAHARYSTLVQTAAALAGSLDLAFDNGDTYYARSDHYNFAKKGIPVVFFCNGEHADYHKVSDHVELLDFAKMERVARLAFWTGWQAAQAKGRPQRLGSQPTW